MNRLSLIYKAFVDYLSTNKKVTTSNTLKMTVSSEGGTKQFTDHRVSKTINYAQSDCQLTIIVIVSSSASYFTD